MVEKIIVIGCGGHAKVVTTLACQSGYEIAGFLDDRYSEDTFLGYPVLGKIENCLEYKEQCCFVVAIGDNAVRARIMSQYDLRYPVLIHPKAYVARTATIGTGTMVMVGAVVNDFACVGKGCILNSGSIVEHDCVLEDYVHISPGVVLCGTVHVGQNVHVGAATVVRNNQSIGADILVGAGAVVVNDLEETGVYVGIPAKRME